MTAIFVREVRSAFSGMMGCLLTAFLTAASGLYFMANNLGFGLTDFGYYTLYQTSFVLLVYVPVLAMRSLAGERHARTDQLLLTSPVPVWGIVLGKYFAMCAVFALPCLADAAMILALRALGCTNTALAANFASLLGYYLLGCAAIALCEWISGLTENQIVAAVLGFAALLLAFLMPSLRSLFTAGSAMALVAFTLLAAAAAVLAGLRSRSLTLGCILFAALAAGFGRRERDLELLGLGVLFSLKGVLVRGTHAVADVDGAGRKDAVLADEVGVVGLAADDFAGEIVGDGEIGVGLEDDLDVGHARGEIGVRREVHDARFLVRELAVGDAAPEHGVRFGHVVAPEHHRVALFDVAVDVGRFIDAEGLIKAHHGRGHAKACVGVDVVAAETGLHELARHVGFGNRVLARAHDRNALGALLFIDAAELALHLVEGLLPGDGFELAVFVVLAVGAAHQRLREAVLTVEDLGVEVALDAVEAAVDRRIGVALGGDDTPVEGAYLQAAARAAEAADALSPDDAGVGILGGLRHCLRHRQPHGHGRGGGHARLQEFTARDRDDFLGHVFSLLCVPPWAPVFLLVRDRGKAAGPSGMHAARKGS